MGYDAIGLGPHDLIAEESIITQLRSADLPLLSCNLYDQSNELVFPPYKSYQLAGLSVAVIGVTGNLSLQTDQYHLADGLLELSKQVASLRTTHEVIIVLSTLQHAHAIEAVTSKITGIDILIGGDWRQAAIGPLQQGETIISQSTDEGKALGVLDINWRGKPWKINHQKRLSQLKITLNRINQSLIKSRRTTASAQASSEQTKRLQKSKDQVLRQIEETMQGLNETVDLAHQSTFRARSITLDNRVTEDQEMSALLRAAGF